MNRFIDLVRFIDFDSDKNFIIEPESREPLIRDMLFELIAAQKPGVIVKAGIGNHRFLKELAESSSSYLVVIDPSMNNIKNFMARHGGSARCGEIKFINGFFETLPVDYYAADLVICIDNFDFIYSGRVVDEFRTSIDFDKLLFLAGVVLHPDDTEGVLDDLMKEIFPLHNDYYLPNDLETFLTLNEFTSVKGSSSVIAMDVKETARYLAGVFGKDARDPAPFLESGERPSVPCTEWRGAS